MRSGLCLPAESPRLPVVGEIFGADAPAAKPYEDAFRVGLRELGYVEGKNIIVLTRYANGDARRVPVLLRELIAHPVDVLVVSQKAVHAAKQSAKAIPIVCPTMSDPVGEGLAETLSRPGGNVTGISAVAPETNSKRLELLLEVVPNLKKLAVLIDGNDHGLMSELDEFRVLAHRVGVNVQSLAVRSAEEVGAALKTLDRDRPQALLVFDSAFTEQYSETILRFAAHRLPVVSEGRDWADAGAVLTYAPSYRGMWMRSATYVDRLLKGAKPSELPIEQPTKFELVVNLKTAKALGITIPESISVRADELIR